MSFTAEWDDGSYTWDQIDRDWLGDPLPLRITAGELPPGITDSSYRFVLTATGGVPPYSWFLAGGALPADLELGEDGIITGDITDTFNIALFTVGVSDSQVPPVTTLASLEMEGRQSGFAARLYEQLEPFARLDMPDIQGRQHLWILCLAIGSMFDQVEDITQLRPDDLVGYADMIDVDRARSSWLGFTAMFAGVRLATTTDIYSGAGPQLIAGSDPPSLVTPQEQRDWIRQRRRWLRARPEALIEEVQFTLIGNKTVLLRERVNSAWNWVVVTVEAETPNPAATEFVILSHKPAPDTFQHLIIQTLLWFRVNELYTSWQDVYDTYANYHDLRFAEFH